ncbi:hypothetical protein Tco_1165489, partial [Tanacetum coccineum]
MAWWRWSVDGGVDRGGIEVRWCGCDDGGSHGGVEDEARGPVDRIDRVAGRVSKLGVWLAGVA